MAFKIWKLLEYRYRNEEKGANVYMEEQTKKRTSPPAIKGEPVRTVVILFIRYRMSPWK